MNGITLRRPDLDHQSQRDPCTTVAFAGRLIPPAFARGDAERHHQTTTLHRAAFRVGAQVADELRLVQISGHDLIPSFTPFREGRRHHAGVVPSGAV
jgi:hypothetical protein